MGISRKQGVRVDEETARAQRKRTRILRHADRSSGASSTYFVATTCVGATPSSTQWIIAANKRRSPSRSGQETRFPAPTQNFGDPLYQIVDYGKTDWTRPRPHPLPCRFSGRRRTEPRKSIRLKWLMLMFWSSPDDDAKARIRTRRIWPCPAVCLPKYSSVLTRWASSVPCSFRRRRRKAGPRSRTFASRCRTAYIWARWQHPNT
jgi:hypothetical protein